MNLLVGVDRLALSGLSGPVTLHRHATAAVVVGLDRPMRIAARGNEREVRTALLAPGFEHAVDLRGGRMAVFLLPPRVVRAELTELASGPWLELGASLDTLEGFEPVDRALRAGARPIDARLSAAMARLAAQLDTNVPVDALAAGVRLSPTRLMALAREQLGTSLRAYRRWLRAFQVARAFAGGATLTDAALAAGFSSSAHLSAAARESFGIRPTQVLNPGNHTRLLGSARD